MPRDIIRTTRRQLRIEIGVRRPTKLLACDLAIRLALVGVNESAKVRARSLANFCSSFVWNMISKEKHG
jgi:hypothetical protein